MIAIILFHIALAGVASLSLALFLVSFSNLETTLSLSIKICRSVVLWCSLNTDSRAAVSAAKLS